MWFVLTLLMVALTCMTGYAATDFCPPSEPPKVTEHLEHIASKDMATLLNKLSRAQPRTTFLLADGVYTLPSNTSLEINQPGITIRSASGKRDNVVIQGGSNNISVNKSNFTVADLTLKGAKFHSVQIRGEQGVVGATIYNVRLVDAGQQFVKGSVASGNGPFAEDGLVACSLIEYTTYSKGNGVTAADYTDGVDILSGKGWTIRDNVFRRIRSQAGPAGPAILMWRNSQDTVIQRNTFIDCWRGIALGLAPPDKLSRGGIGVVYDHQNGLVENNVFLALTERADAAIENNYAKNSRVLHNTVYYNPAITHAVPWGIEYRFTPTTGIVIQNNLTNRPIFKRVPDPITNALLGGNLDKAQASWFRDVSNGDVHLVPGAPPIDHGIVIPDSLMDLDGDARPIGAARDVGADERK
jgi:hypothetical protein